MADVPMHAAAEEIVAVYERHAAHWDGDRSKALIERPWLDAFLAAMPERPRLLDLGCGSGDPIATYLASAGAAITGVDASSAMIGLCRGRLPDQTWIVADMRALDLGQTFHGLLAWDSFFHLRADDQRAMFEIFKMHAAPAAALMFTSGPEEGEVIGQYRGNDLYHASLDPQDYTALLDGIGFEVLRHASEDAACGGHTIWLAKKRA